MGLELRGRTMLAGGGALAALIVGGGAYAVAAQGSKSLSACVHHRGGGLYEAKKCARHDRKLSWSIAGPQGSPGVAGRDGTNGTNGVNGINGINGTNGTNATTYTLTLAANGASDTLAPLGSSAYLYAVCNYSNPDRIGLLGVGDSQPWSVAGSYSKFQYSGNSTTLAYNGGGLAPTGTYAIGDQLASGGNGSVLEDSAPQSDTGIFSGSMEATVASGSTTANYIVNFELVTIPGTPGSCRVVASVSAAG